MTQHTPGPWDATGIEEGDLAEAYYVTNNDGRRVCLIAGYGERKRYRSPKCDDALNAEDVANARLIAAAPDLLKACRLMLDAVNEHHKDGSILWVSPGTTAWELLTDVIGKATVKIFRKPPDTRSRPTIEQQRTTSPGQNPQHTGDLNHDYQDTQADNG